MNERRKLYAFTSWDMALALLFCFFLLWGALVPAMILVALGIALLIGALVATRAIQRRRRWRTNPPGEFWADRFDKK